MMRAARLRDALQELSDAIREVEAELVATSGNYDALASQVFV